LKAQLLRASLLHAKALGFSDACITAACKDLGFSSVSSHFLIGTQITGGVLKRGPIDVVDFAMNQWLEQLKEDLRDTDFT